MDAQQQGAAGDVEAQGDPSRDPSVQNPDTNVSPAVTPADDNNVDTYDKDDDNGNDFDIASLNEAAANLSPSEIPSVNEVPAIVGVLLYHAQHGELPKPLDERYPQED